MMYKTDFISRISNLFNSKSPSAQMQDASLRIDRMSRRKTFTGAWLTLLLLLCTLILFCGGVTMFEAVVLTFIFVIDLPAVVLFWLAKSSGE